jgi:hypothetical protein
MLCDFEFVNLCILMVDLFQIKFSYSFIFVRMLLLFYFASYCLVFLQFLFDAIVDDIYFLIYYIYF